MRPLVGSEPTDLSGASSCGHSGKGADGEPGGVEMLGCRQIEPDRVTPRLPAWSDPGLSKGFPVTEDSLRTRMSRERRRTMSQHGTDRSVPPQVGYLRSCMDRRFVEATRQKFEEVTGLAGAQYYHEAFAGGALNFLLFPPPPPNPNPDGADYVYHNPEIQLIWMGWQAHLNHCGGLKDKHDDWIEAHFRDLANSRRLQEKYPRVKHVFLLA